MSQAQEKPDQAQGPEPALPPCCNSGCTVCVLDYPELFMDPGGAEMAAMLEAIEQAQRAVAGRQREGDPHEE